MNWEQEIVSCEQKLRLTAVEATPFPHFAFSNVFSPDFYQSILDHLPDDEAYEWARGSIESEWNRGYFVFNRQFFKRLTPSQASFWKRVRKWMQSDHFSQLILDKYGTQIAARFRQEPPGSHLVAELKLIRDQNEYGLQPHTDAPDRVTTIMFYLPTDESLREFGTAIYWPKDEQLRCAGHQRHEYRDFTLLKKAPFLPNSGLCFLKSDSSFHGVEPLVNLKAPRNFLTFSIRCLPAASKVKFNRFVQALKGNEPNRPVHTTYL